MRTASAFCPGHITAFFEICDESENPLKRGSRGAGLSISLGARSKVTIQDSSEQIVDISIDGKKSDALVTKDSISRIIGDSRLTVIIETTLDLPQSQGFAMSAAGSLSSCFALCSLIGRPSAIAYEACHLSEIRNKTGLGDIAGIGAKGIEFRMSPGLPPHGKVDHIDGSGELVLAVVGKPIMTSDILTDTKKRASINEAGRRCVSEFELNRSIDHLFALGTEFVEDSGLVSKEVLKALLIADEHGMASMVMLGNSIFCMGDTQEIVESMRPLGETHTCEIDNVGPRLI